jgi:hypothetical protein
MLRGPQMTLQIKHGGHDKQESIDANNQLVRLSELETREQARLAVEMLPAQLAVKRLCTRLHMKRQHAAWLLKRCVRN